MMMSSLYSSGTHTLIFPALDIADILRLRYVENFVNLRGRDLQGRLHLKIPMN